MTKKTQSKAANTDEIPLEQLVDQRIRDAVVQIGKQIDMGDIVATNVQTLVSISRHLQQRNEPGVEDLDRSIRALDPKTRLELLSEWSKLDGKKRSGLA